MSATTLVLCRTVTVGERQYVWACGVGGSRIRWFYMPFGVWQTGFGYDKYEVGA